MVTLKNVSRRIQVYNLVHELLADAEEKSFGYQDVKVVTVDHDATTGARYARNATKRVPSSLTIVAGETLTGLPDELLECPEIGDAIDRGDLHLVKQTLNEVSHPGGARHSQRPLAKE